MLSRADEALVARDRDLPGLRTVLDPLAFSDVLRRRAPELGESAPAPRYVRYKPGTRCLVAYDLQIGQRQLHLHANAYAARRWPPGPAAHRHLAERSGSVSVPDQALVITIFPHDAVLPLLSRLQDPGLRPALLKKLSPDASSLHGAAVTTLAYKPERRYVGLLEGEGVRAVIKLYAAAEFRRARAAVATPQLTELLHTPGCIGRSRRHRAIVLEWLPGYPLTDLLTPSRFDVEYMQRAGSALAELHRRLRYLSGGAPHRAPDDGLVAARAVAALSPDLGDRALRLAAATEAHRREGPRQLVHGDFYPGQVLVGDRVGVLDFDRAGVGDPAADVGNFLAHLECAEIDGQLDPALKESASEGFLAGYDQSARTSLKDRIGPHVAAGLLRLSPRPFRSRAVDWADRMSAVLDGVERQLVRHASRHSHWPSAIPDRVVDPFDVLRDQVLGVVPDVLDPAAVAQALGRLPVGQAGRVMEVSAIRVIRHKPGRRCLIEYDIAVERPDRSVDRWTAIGKLRSKGADRRTCELSRRLRQAGLDGRPPHGTSVPEPVGLLPEWKMWLQRKAPGTSVDCILDQVEPETLGRRAAEAIHALQRAGAMPRRSHTAQSELTILREGFLEVEAKRPQWRYRLDALLDGCAALLTGLPDRPPCGVHRDFHPGQLILDGDGAYLLDLDLYAAGDPALDMGNFLAHLAEHAVRTFDDVRRLAPAEAAGFERFLHLTPAVDRHRLEVYRLVSLARHVQISMRIADRKAFTERILDYCEHELAAVSLGTPREPPAPARRRPNATPRSSGLFSGL